MKQPNCCTHYNGTGEYDEGYVILPVFRVAVCHDCGEVTMICNGFLGWIFQTLFAPFWTGKVILRRKAW